MIAALFAPMSVAASSVIGAVVAQNVFFYLIATVMVVAALRVVTTSNMVHAALYLVVVLAGVAAQFLLLGAEFVGVTQVLVYIGAVIVLFLFGIMLTRAKVGTEDGLNHDNVLPAILTAVLLLLVMGYAVVDFGFNQTAATSIAGAVVADLDSVGEVLDLEPNVAEELSVVTFRAPENDDDPALDLSLFVERNQFAQSPGVPVRDAEVTLLDSDGEILEQTITDVNGRYRFEELSQGEYTIVHGDLEKNTKLTDGVREIDVLQNSPTTVEQVSDSIFSTYIVAFEAISVLLLAALIGAIVVARKE